MCYYYSLSSSTSQEIDLSYCQCSVWIGNYSFRKYCSFLFRSIWVHILPNIRRARGLGALMLKESHWPRLCTQSPPTPPLMLCLLSLAPVVLLCVAERIAARNGGCLRQALSKMSVGDLPASPQARASRADGVCASQAAGHSRLKGQRLHGTGGVWAVVVLLGGKERLRGIASRWGRVQGLVACFAFIPLLGFPAGLAPSHGLWAAPLVLIFADGGVCATHKRGVGDVRARAGRGLWWRSSGTGGAGLWGGRHRTLGAVALETGIKKKMEPTMMFGNIGMSKHLKGHSSSLASHFHVVARLLRDKKQQWPNCLVSALLSNLNL